jgi:CRP-like cAMP-binding protein
LNFLTQLGNLLTYKRIKKGEYIYHHKQKAENLYGIIRGRVSLRKARGIKRSKNYLKKEALY